MDKEIIYFLVSESRIVGFSSEPDSEEMMQYAREAILFGDRNIRIVEVQVSIGLSESESVDETDVNIRHSENIELTSDMLDAFDECRLRAQQMVWESMPQGVYRISKKDGGVTIEFCPDIGEANWQKVEMTGWGYQSRQ
jgi:hypothetical protein